MHIDNVKNLGIVVIVSRRSISPLVSCLLNGVNDDILGNGFLSWTSNNYDGSKLMLTKSMPS